MSQGPIHESAVQLRVDAVALAIQAIDKPRWGRKDETRTAADYDAELLTTAQAIHGFLTASEPADAITDRPTDPVPAGGDPALSADPSISA